jgi:hypothetical protein
MVSARHEVLIRARALQTRAKALRTLAIAKAVRFFVRASINLSRAVFIGLVVLAVLHAYLVRRDATAPTIEIVRTHPLAPAAPDLQHEASTEPNSAPADPAAPSSQATDPKAAGPLPPALQKTPEWTETEIADAKAECTRLLDKVTVVTEPLPPAREGACGAPAPRELQSVGESKVKFQPPATLRCPMIAALNTWISDKLQPAAKKSFGSPIARVLAGSYSCRNRYGLARAPISEHAYMNAIDISGFVLENGKIIRVSKSWTPPKEEATAEAKKSGPARAGHAKAVTVVAVRIATSKAGATDDVDKSKNKPDETKKPEKDPTSEFLHVAHHEACEIFGTVLGPDANAAHHDHFHLDMKERKYRSICH